MLNIFDIANVDVFIEKSGDKSIIGSWNRIKTELKELDTTPNKQSTPCSRDSCNENFAMCCIWKHYPCPQCM